MPLSKCKHINIHVWKEFSNFLSYSILGGVIGFEGAGLISTNPSPSTF